MKSLSLFTALLIFGCILSASCHRDAVPASTAKLQNTWHYIGYSGGFAGRPFTKDDSKADYYIKFDNNNYSWQKPDGKGCSSYSVINKKDSSGFPGPFLKINGEDGLSTFHISHDTLTLGKAFIYDGMTSWYVRVNINISPCDSVKN